MAQENGTALRGEKFKEVLLRTPLRISNLPVFGSSQLGLKIKFFESLPRKNKKEKKDYQLKESKGQFFVSMPEELAEAMRGSYVPPDEFLKQLKNLESDSTTKVKKALIGDHVSGDDGKRKTFEYEENSFQLNVFHGSTNELALELTEIASELIRKDLDQSHNMVHYQHILAEIVKPVIESSSKTRPAIRIVEDCLASGDTIIGVLAALQQKTKLTEMTRVRVDVAVGTAQGILLLKKFAQDNGINLELNVGYMAFGLSKGKPTPGKGFEHSNYITYPDGFIEELSDHPNGFSKLKNMQVVGDMGENGRKVEGLKHLTPWYNDLDNPQIREGEYPVFVYLANGGYLMRGYTHNFLGEQMKESSEVIFSAKRRHDEGDKISQGLGYGVLLYGLPMEILP